MSPTEYRPAIQCFSRTVTPPGNLPGLRRWVASRTGGVMLESVAHDDHWGRYSIFAVEPRRTIEIPADSPLDPFEELAKSCRPWISAAEADIPFSGGWIGYFAYEAGRFVEPAAGWPSRANELPLACWGLYDSVLIADHLRDEWTVAGFCLSGGAGIESRIRFWESALEESALSTADPQLGEIRAGQWNNTRPEYLAAVDRVRDYIRAGDVFQANIARRYRAACTTDPTTIYQLLCEANPATYSAFLQSPAPGQWAVLSSSPELFLAARGRDVITRPIKGTRPRGRDLAEDMALRTQLDESAKDRAELNMIIDLQRNDLGRVCEFGSVRVSCDGEIENLPTVFHRTATITGRLCDGRDAIDLLRAAFPGGSITGAPKVRAMQIIAELEPFPRGPYCGAIGYIALNGDMQLNIPIRTMTLAGSTLDLFVGSGIVADSDPIAEYEELTAKAAGMMNAIGRQAPPPIQAAANRSQSLEFSGPARALAATRRRAPHAIGHANPAIADPGAEETHP